MAAKATKAAIGVLEDILKRSDEEMAAVHAQIDRDRERLAEIRGLLDPNLANVRLGPAPDRETVFRARAERPDMERRLAEAELRALAIDRANTQARENLRAVRLAELRPGKREVIEALTPALLAVRQQVDRLIAIEDQEEQIVGISVERLAAMWTGLGSARSSAFTPTLDVWLELVGRVEAKS